MFSGDAIPTSPASMAPPPPYPPLPRLASVRLMSAQPGRRRAPSTPVNQSQTTGTQSEVPSTIRPSNSTLHSTASFDLSEIPLKGESLPGGIRGYSYTLDATSSSLFLYGGYKEPSKDELVTEPVGDLWQLDLNTYEWINRTNEFSSYEDVKYNPDGFSGIPILRGSSMAYAVLNNRKLLFIAGAHTIHPEDFRQPVLHETKIVAVDLERKLFWDIAPHGGPIRPREDATMTILDGYLYLFGGTDIVDAGEPNSIRDSYCVARFLPRENGWTWVVKDQLYGRGVPSLGYSIGLQPIYYGTKLALFPGTTAKSRIDITGRNIVFFDTRERKFSVQRSTTGTFPMKCFRYSLGSKGSPSVGAGHLAERIYLVTWTTNPPDGSHIVSKIWDLELWEYKLPPEQTFTPLNLTADIKHLDFDPEEFFVMGDRLIVFGSKASTMGEGGGEFDMCVEIQIRASGK